MKKCLVFILTLVMTICSVGFADYAAVTLTKYSTTEGYTFNSDWTRTVEFVGTSTYGDVTLAGRITLKYDDGIFNDYDRMQVPVSNGMATGQIASVCVLNNGLSSGFSENATAGHSSDLRSVKHTSSSVRYKTYFAYTD